MTDVMQKSGNDNFVVGSSVFHRLHGSKNGVRRHANGLADVVGSAVLPIHTKHVVDEKGKARVAIVTI